MDTIHVMLTSRPVHNDAHHAVGSTTNQTSYIDRPTVQQLKLAFQETPIQLREIENGWKGRRKQQMVRPSTKSPTPGLKGRPSTHVDERNKGLERAQGYLPSPPSTPLESHEPEVNTSRNAPMKEMHKTRQPRPILAFPLIPTLRPIKVVSGVYVYIPTPTHHSEYELRLYMSQRRVTVLSGGMSLSTIPTTTGREGQMQLAHQINLDQCDDWAESERGQWELVAELVECVKRKTPRVSLSLLVTD